MKYLIELPESKIWNNQLTFISPEHHLVTNYIRYHIFIWYQTSNRWRNRWVPIHSYLIQYLPIYIGASLLKLKYWAIQSASNNSIVIKQFLRTHIINSRKQDVGMQRPAMNKSQYLLWYKLYTKWYKHYFPLSIACMATIRGTNRSECTWSKDTIDLLRCYEW